MSPVESVSQLGSVPDTDADVARHLEDIRGFVRFAAGNKSVARETFEDVPFLLTQEPEGKLRWVAPADTYLDMPFVTTGLAALYSWNLEDDGDDAWWSEPDRHASAGIYLDVEGIEDFLRSVGSAALRSRQRASSRIRSLSASGGSTTGTVPTP